MPRDDDGPPPSPKSSIDIVRMTKVSLEYIEEAMFHVVWHGSDSDAHASTDIWTGYATFDKLPKAPLLHEFLRGRIARCQMSDRLGDVWPEVREIMISRQEKESD